MIKKLAENYQHIEQTLIEELKIDGSSGTSSAPNIWHPIFKRIVPTKYNVEKDVYIIDSEMNVSEKVSLAIYDEQYTPYIFNHGMIKYIPIEAVFAVVLCEDNVWIAAQKTIQYTDEDCKKKTEPQEYWLCKLQKLKTDMNAYVRIQSIVIDTKEASSKHKEKCNDPKIPKQTQTSTRPITILCRSGRDIESTESANCFDIVLDVEEQKITKNISKDCWDLQKWYKELNHYDLSRYENEAELKSLIINDLEKGRTLQDLSVKKNDDEQVLLSLMFQLNQLLMLINNPMFFPHASYASAFDEGEEKK